MAPGQENGAVWTSHDMTQLRRLGDGGSGVDPVRSHQLPQIADAAKGPDLPWREGEAIGALDGDGELEVPQACPGSYCAGARVILYIGIFDVQYRCDDIV